MVNNNYDVYMCRESELFSKLKRFIGLPAKETMKSLSFNQLLVEAYDEGLYVSVIQSNADGIIRDIKIIPR